ncbi:hypothetical protein NIES2119_21920 [[Phormidium ambiguum] IAM M-71]|uniref:Calcium-binding protein n=1 Tax=[Phormidium ambiguum] IAM M-71 TaxID=454136 RepID=A0A1U7IBE6_9CYAN|nr:calcium-binding protein [Phormidium ambiguum]OKH33951.1 hypothetical protein NIES2119_21920 [Phormidium ambiguum IAM M-71]
MESHNTILSDDQLLTSTDSLIIQSDLTDINLDSIGLVEEVPLFEETDINFSIVSGEAPPPLAPNTGNDTITPSTFLLGDSNPNYLSAVSSFVESYIWGFGGNDTLVGGFNNDILNGGADNDFLDGRLGDDLLIGGAGNDTLDGNYGYDILDGGDGIDTATYRFWWGGIKANLKTETVNFFNDPTSGIEYVRAIENVVGSLGNDEIIGNSANNVLFGERGNDFLSGEEGNDFLQGSENSNFVEQDTLTGGLGADTFVLGTANGGSFYLGDGFVTITDFKWWEKDTFQVVGSINDYHLDKTQNFGGTSLSDTAIYRGNDLIAVALDTFGIMPVFDFKSV